MGYRFDYLVAPLRCPQCGWVAQADEMLDMTTRLRAEPNLAYLTIGDSLPVTPELAVAAGYVQLRLPGPHEPVVLLHPWACVACGTGANWAEVVVEEDVIEAIDEAVLDDETLARAHFRAPPDSKE